jgi:hypothetical protein
VLLSADGDGTAASSISQRGSASNRPVCPFRSRNPRRRLTAPDSEPILVLIGTSHPVVETLIKNNKWERPPLQPGEG